MSETNVRNLRNAMHTAQTWLIDLTEKGSFTDEAQAYRVLRAVLQSLRDRLTVEEAAHLGAQLPMVIRGVYYDGFRPSELPRKQRRRDEYLASVRERLTDDDVDAETACRATFSLLQDRISRGEIEETQHLMSADLRELWPETS